MSMPYGRKFYMKIPILNEIYNPRIQVVRTTGGSNPKNT